MEPNPQGAYDLESIYAEAVKQFKMLRDNGRLSSSDYDLLTSTKQPQDILASVDEAITKGSQVHPNAKRRIRAVAEPLLLRLERFGAAIDMVVQSSPQVHGLNLVGLIWGGIKFILVIARDITETFDTVCDVLDDIRKSLPALEVYAKIFGSSDIQLLKAPLVNIYMQLIMFGVQAIKLFNRSMLKTLGRSTWISLKEDFQSLIKKLQRAGKEVDRMANVEHLHQSDWALKAQEVEGRKAEAFRQELRWRLAGPGEGISSGNQAPLPSFNDAPIDLITAYFIGRDSELQNVTNAFDAIQGDKPARYAIYGMAGLGKSQLALQYSNISFSQGHYSHIFWLSATSLEKLNQGFTKVLDLVNHPDRYHPDQSVKLTASRRWLEESGCTKWLLIFDNVEEESVEFIRHHLPRKNAFGNILFTTRTQNIAESVVNAAGQRHLTVELTTLSLEDSAILLVATAKVDATDVMKSKAGSLVKRIGCLPLAVDHAGSFMKQCHMGVEDVQKLYDSQQMIQVIGWDNRLTPYEQKSVLAAFSLPLKRLDEISLDMSNLLKTLSFLDTESISLDILVLGAEKAGQIREDAMQHIESEQKKLTSNNKSSVLHKWKARWRGHKSQPHPTGTLPNNVFANTSKLQAELQSLLRCISSPEWIHQTIQEFENLSLAKHQCHDNKSSLTMHDLIQVVVQTTASHDDSGRDYYALAVTLICSAWCDIEDPTLPKCWSQCEKLIPHINSLTKWADTQNTNNCELIRVNAQLGRHLNSKGRYKEAERLQEKVLAIREMQCGADHISTLVTVHDLAQVYHGQGRYNEAETLYKQALAGHEKQLGADHPETLVTVRNLAQVYESQGRLNEAEILYWQVLGGQEKQHGADYAHYPETLITVHNLARVYRKRGRYNDAETLYRQVLAGQEKQLGADHPETLITVHNCAQVYQSQGRYNEAETLYRQALARKEKQLGADHPETLATVHGLAQVYQSQGRYKEAETLYGQALAGKEKQLGADHPSTLTTVHNLADVYQSQGRYNEAEPLYRQALAGSEKQLGADHPETLITVHSLAQMYQRQGRYDEAEALYRRALAGHEKQLGADHPHTLTAAHNLALFYESQGRHNDNV